MAVEAQAGVAQVKVAVEQFDGPGRRILARVGFLISTFLLLIFLFRAGGFRKWTPTVAIAFVTLSLSYLFFSSWLNIRFPKGFLGF